MTEDELKKTILQEMHRLNFSSIVNNGGANSNSASTTTKNAFEFAELAYKLIK